MSNLLPALDELYRRHRQALFTCALAVTRGPETAEDAVHDAFCRLARMKEEPRDLKAYAFRAVRNSAVDLVRKRPPAEEEAIEGLFDDADDPATAAVKNEFRQQVSRALLTLSPDERETVIQHLYGDLTFREIAEIREAPLGTVTAWYRRGIEKLRSHFEVVHE